MHEFKGIFIDDNKVDLDIYSNLLSEITYSDFKINTKGLSPKGVTEIASDILTEEPDVLFLDFRLDEYLHANDLDANQGYKGGGLAQILREKIISDDGVLDFPIILLSAENNIENLYSPDKTSHDLFDSCYTKEHLGNDANHEKLLKKIVALIKGYKQLAAINNNEILSIFDQNPDEDTNEIINKQEIKQPLLDSKVVHIQAKFILKNMMRREGVFLSRYEVMARMGSHPNHADEQIFTILESKGCKYNGIFSDGWERWWAHRFEDFLVETVGHRPYSQTAKERVTQINEKLSTKLVPAKSRWNNSEDEKVVFACSFCRNPTEIRHSLAVYDPYIPRFVQKKRLCNKCIQEHQYVTKKIMVDEADQKFIPSILEAQY